MGCFEELETTKLHERNVAPPEFDLESGGVVARPKQHGLVPKRDTLLAQRQHLFTDVFGLGSAHRDM